MEDKKQIPTMREVAEEAGVSLGTVSKVVNGIAVGKSYQRRVEAAINKLGYKVNSYAKGLKSNKTNTIAFLVPDTVNPFFGRLTFCINRMLARRGYRMLLCATEASSEMEQALVEMAEQNRVDGIICQSYNPALRVQEGTRLVTIDRHVETAAPCVASDNFTGGKAAAYRLAELGCRRLLHLSIGSALPNEASKRRDGFLSACASLGVEYDMLCLEDGTPYSRFTEYLSSRAKGGAFDFDGIFCGTDHLACFIMECLGELGISVPDDVQIIGFDGIQDFVSRRFLCSTIVQPVEQIAEMSVKLVLMEDQSVVPSLVCLPVRYASGGTTKEEYGHFMDISSTSFL